MNRDIITIGASAGGIEVLLDVVRDLPVDLPASVFVVVHVPPTHASLLPELLTERGRLPARHPVHEEQVEPATIYIAPPDNHLALRQGSMEVTRGPRENGHRPAVNTLFRTASAAYGSRVIGVVLSGYQDCGTAGMLSIKSRCGLAVVQQPDTAVAPDMPRSVIDNVAVDHVVSPRELGPLLAQLVKTPAPGSEKPGAIMQQLEGDVLGVPANVVCPICDGVMTETQSGAYEHFRCHVGHSFSLSSLVREQGDQMERALWGAVRALEESAALSAKLAARESGQLRVRFAEKARAQRAEAKLIRKILLQGATLSDADAELT
ncbi:MAG TPA: chemotaxis protein CheB [Kofleriaceae bacterium]|nr:chemotaxis protein CheB [Kofleriaceae bacterium]